MNKNQTASSITVHSKIIAEVAKETAEKIVLNSTEAH